MSRTIIMFECDSSKRASPITCRASRSYPRVSHLSDAATRCGVLSSPSRSGSSPMSSSWRRTSSSRSSVSCVFDIVVLGFPQNEPLELCRGDSRLENLPERDDDVLRSRDHAAHELHVEVEVAMIDDVHDLALDYFLQAREVQHVAGAVVNGTFDRYVESVVVAVPVRIVAFPERRLVLGVGEGRVEHAMRCIESEPAGNCYVRHDQSVKKNSAGTLRRRRSQELQERRGFLKPCRMYEALTAAFCLPRTGA